jgi:hypothetical protein
MSYSAEQYKRIAGVEPPKPFALKTPAERIHDREQFLALVNTSQDEDAVDELFKNVRMNPSLHAVDIEEDEQVSAA